MVYSYVTYSKISSYFFISFRNEDFTKKLVLKFLPNISLGNIFSQEHIDINRIINRDLDIILNLFESYGLTMITEGLIDL